MYSTAGRASETRRTWRDAGGTRRQIGNVAVVVRVCITPTKTHPLLDGLLLEVATRRPRGDPTSLSSFFEFTHRVCRLCPPTPIPNQGPAVPPATPTAQLAPIVCN